MPVYKRIGTGIYHRDPRPPPVKDPELKLRPKGAKPTAMLALDHERVPKKDPVKVVADGSFRIDGTHRAFYYEVRR